MPLVLFLLYSVSRSLLFLKEKSRGKKKTLPPVELLAIVSLSAAIGWLIMYSHQQFTAATATVYMDFDFDYPAWISLLVMYGADLAFLPGVFRSLKKRSLVWQYAFSSTYSVLLMFTVEFMMMMLSIIILMMLSKEFIY